jgi:hypothetical protein
LVGWMGALVIMNGLRLGLAAAHFAVKAARTTVDAPARWRW